MSDRGTALDRAMEAFNAHNVDGYLEIYDAGARFYGYGPSPLDLAGARAFYGMVFSAFPDARLAIEARIEQDDTIAARYVVRGTHQGGFLGVAASGKPVELTGQTFLKFAGDKVVERWQAADFLGLMVQMGVAPQTS